MYSYDAIKKGLQDVEFDSALTYIYGANFSTQKERYLRVLETFGTLFGTDVEIGFFSAPGRSEICGNHTDHNHGKVLAGFQVPKAERGEFAAALAEIGYPFTDVTNDPAYKYFLKARS